MNLLNRRELIGFLQLGFATAAITFLIEYVGSFFVLIRLIFIYCGTLFIFMLLFPVAIAFIKGIRLMKLSK